MARAQEAGATSSLLAPASESSEASEASEWRLDGVIVRADAAGSALWLQAEVTILQGEASLDGADRARRISVDSETRVWTPDGQTRPFGFNALDQAVRERREVSVVGIWATSPAGPILRARLLVLPDLLPSNWQPRPFGAARRPARPSSAPRAANTRVARPATRPRLGAISPQSNRPPARSSGPNRQAAEVESAAAARRARAREDAERAAAREAGRQATAHEDAARDARIRAETARATANRAAQRQAAAQEEAARARAAQASAEREAQRVAERVAARAAREATAREAAQAAARLQAQRQATAEEEARARAREARAREAQAGEARAKAQEARAQQARAQAEARAAAARAAAAREAAAREAAAREAAARAAAAREAAAREVAQVAQRQARAQEERVSAEEARAAERARVAAQRPALSRARASSPPLDSAAAALRPATREARGFAASATPRDSKPPLLASSLPASPSAAGPSSPRLASATPEGEGQVAQPSAPGASEPGPGIASRIAPRLQNLPPAAPRDAEHEKLLAAPPQASRQTVPSTWSARSPGAGLPSAPAPESTAKSLGMRATLPASQARATVTPPLLSSQPYDSGSRLSGSRLAAPAAPRLKRTPLQAPSSTPGLASSEPVLEPGAAAGAEPEDAVQVLADGERAAFLARTNFAALRATQDQVPWLDFCGGPGWDARDGREAGPGVAADGPGEPRAMPRLIALTFDDGPHPNTPRILDILEANGARGTFFVVGRNVQKHPGILREIARRGHDVGSHSMHHFQGVRLSLGDWEREVDGNSQAISAILGQAPRWFRAPGCRYSDEALEVLRSRHLVRVDSSNNSGDWHENDPNKIVAHVLSRLAPGQVILFHDPLPQTATALPILLRELRARGYKCVTLSELAHAAAQEPAFMPPLCPSGQGIVLPSSAFTTGRLAAPQVLEAPGDASALPADAPVLLQVQP